MKFKIEEAAEAYEKIKESEKPIFILLDYENNKLPLVDNYDAIIQYKKPLDSDKINIALAGVGAFAEQSTYQIWLN